MSFYKIALVFSISLILGGIENTCYGVNFRSDQLDEISKHISIDWQLSDTTFTAKHGKRDITIRVSGDCVEHIGFRIFPQQIRSSIINPHIADFVERYWLSLTLPLNRQKSVRQQLTEDRFTFHSGSVESIGIIQNDTTLMFSCQVDPGLVTMMWGEKNSPICHITFPVDHELILGRRMLENDRRLPQEINSIRIKERPARDLSASASMYADTLSSLWIERTGSYLDCALRSERYYTCGVDSTALQPVFDNNRYDESLINLFTDYDIEKARNIRLHIRHQIFGIKEQTIETTVPQFVAYSILNGCRPYVGIVSIDNDNSGKADVLIIMHNSQLGYNHVLRVSVPLESISSGNGTATARLNAFVPTSNIKNLFKN